MGNDRTFKLLADVMSLLGSYSSHELAAAKEYVSRYLSLGESASGLENLLDNLLYMSEGGSGEPVNNENIGIPNGLSQGLSKSAAIKNLSNTESTAPLEKELSEMLIDQNFLTDRQALVQFVSGLFEDKLGVGISDPKISRTAIIRKSLNAFRRLTKAQQQEVFSSAQKIYLRERESGLADWSKSIARKAK